jgi:hypothetical protein
MCRTAQNAESRCKFKSRIILRFRPNGNAGCAGIALNMNRRVNGQGTMNCPKCDADVSDSYEPDDPSVGIYGGWYCDACDLAIGEGDYPREPMEGDVPIMTSKEFRGDRPLGTPISQLSGQPGGPKDLSDPRHAGYDAFCRIARSWGHD